MTLGDILSEALAAGFSDSRYRTAMTSWANEGQTRICLEADIRTELASQSITTVSGTQTSALPDTFARVVDLVNTDDGTVIPSIELRDFDDLPASSGKPYGYLVIGTNLSFYPTPDDAYNLRLRYWALPAAMTSETDTPEIPAQYHHVIVRYVLMRAYQRENDYQAADYVKGLYREDLEKLKGEAQYDSADTPVQVPGSYAYASSAPRFSIPS